MGRCGLVLFATAFLWATEVAGQERTVVANRTADGWPSDQAWAVQEDLRLGTVMGGGPTEFGQISGLAVDSEGRIYVADFQAQEIRVFLPSGEYSHSIGRGGQGPGEFGRIRGLAVKEGGELWVVDVESSRISIFEPDGTFKDSYPRELRGSIIPWPGGFINGDRFVDWDLRVSQGPGGGLTGATLTPTFFDPPGTLEALPPIYVRMGRTSAGEGQVLNRSSTQVVSDNGRIWFAYTDEYMVRQRTLKGDTVLTFRLDVEPLQQNVDSVVRVYRNAGRFIEASQVFPYRRLVNRILTDDAGHVYVFAQGDDLELGTAMDVFRDSGQYLGRMTLPGKVEVTMPPPLIRNGRIYGVVRDEFDVPYVVRWRIIQP